MKKHCTFLRKGSQSIFLKQLAQTTTISLLFPDYELSWESPIETEHLLLLNTSQVPMQFSNPADWEWVTKVPVLEGLPGTREGWKRILGREIKEVAL